MHAPVQTLTLPLPDLELCLVEGGKFMMGDNNGQFEKEKPAHPVQLSSFYIGKFQVTQQLWTTVMGENPSRFTGTRRPVEQVSWNDVQSFFKQLNSLEKISAHFKKINIAVGPFRLPTEAEWEYAARGGRFSQGYTYAGSDSLQQVGWFNDNSDSTTHKVGQLLANELNICDMSGNVWEWCQDRYQEKYYQQCYKQGTVTNPKGPARGSRRFLRGGSCFGDRVECRTVFRGADHPGSRDDFIGFRLVLPFQSVGEP